MNEYQIRQIQERIRDLANGETIPSNRKLSQIAALRWVLTDVCGVTPWIVEHWFYPVDDPKAKGASSWPLTIE